MGQAVLLSLIPLGQDVVAGGSGRLKSVPVLRRVITEDMVWPRFENFPQHKTTMR
jgi:hypothetical protein